MSAFRQCNLIYFVGNTLFTAFSGELGVTHTSIVIQTGLASSIVFAWTGVTIVYVCNYELRT